MTATNSAPHPLPGEPAAVDALALELARVSSELELRDRQLNAIRRVNAALFSQVSVEELIRRALAEAIATTEAEVGSIQLYDPDTDCLVFRHTIDPAAEHLIGLSTPVTQGISGQVFCTRESRLDQRVAENVNFNPVIDQKTGYLSQSMLTVALKRFEGDPIGVMQVLNSRRTFQQRDVEVLEVLAAQAAAAIEAARLTEAARKASILSVLGDISHDIKNMMTPIHTGIWLLRRELEAAFPGLEGQRLRRSGEAGGPGSEKQAAEKTIGWILTFTMEAAARVQTRTQEISDCLRGELAPPVLAEGRVADVIGEVIALLRPVALESGVDIYHKIDPHLPPCFFDSRQLFNAIYNLVNNAIPETGPGGTIMVTLAPDESECGITSDFRENGAYVVQVADTGRGMTDEVRRSLFTESAISTKTGGSGLGTRIVAGIVQRHGGTVEAFSAPGEGTRILMRLPFRPSGAETASDTRGAGDNSGPIGAAC